MLYEMCATIRDTEDNRDIGESFVIGDSSSGEFEALRPGEVTRKLRAPLYYTHHPTTHIRATGASRECVSRHGLDVRVCGVRAWGLL